MKILTLIILATFFVGCETVQSNPKNAEQKTVSRVTSARITFYHKHEDRFGSKIAIGGKAKEGITVAMENAIPYGAKIIIQTLKGIVGSGEFIKQDTGRDVRSRKASRGKSVVVDVYVETKKKYKWLVANMPAYMPIEMYY